MTRIMVVDDDASLVRTLQINLRARGYQVLIGRDGRTALQVVADDKPDLIVLDLGLPDLPGVTVLRQLRTHSTVPVIVLSARHSSDDKVEALDLGADDYVTKPFGVEELMARIRAALRHAPTDASAGPDHTVITCGSLYLDLDNHVARKHGQAVHLTPTEWRLVETLTRHPGRLIRQNDLLREVWGAGAEHQSHYLRVYLSQLRRKLEDDPRRPRHFHTEPGVGHRFIP